VAVRACGLCLWGARIFINGVVVPYWYVKALFLFSRTLAAIGIFCLAVLSLTRLDFLVNNVLYSFGLTFSEAWHQEYSILYFLVYQLLIFTLLVYTRNLKLFLFFQVFVLTSTQDLVYFGLWQGSFPVHQWVWTAEYKLFGFWNTANQLLLSLCSISSILILLRFARVPVWMRTLSIVRFFSSKNAKQLQKSLHRSE
jgi:hypothetical protein